MIGTSALLCDNRGSETGLRVNADRSLTRSLDHSEEGLAMKATRVVFGDSRMPFRFWAKISVGASGCWLWTATVDHDGYGQFKWDGSMRGAHKVAYQVLVGEVPQGLQLDHLCRIRRCVNVSHLEVVTSRVNTLRGLSPAAAHALVTHCRKGHPYSPENTYLWHGSRHCRACNARRKREAKRGVAP